jgi:hypothetical protein
MNVALRIAKLERLVSDVSRRRAQDRVSLPGKSGRTNLAGWDSLERDFRLVLGSLRQKGMDVKLTG